MTVEPTTAAVSAGISAMLTKVGNKVIFSMPDALGDDVGATSSVEAKYAARIQLPVTQPCAQVSAAVPTT